MQFLVIAPPALLLIAAALGFAQHRRFTADEVLLSVNPLFHVVGMQQVAARLACGGDADDDGLATDRLTCIVGEAAGQHEIALITRGARGDATAAAHLEAKAFGGGRWSDHYPDQHDDDRERESPHRQPGVHRVQMRR